MLGGIPSLSPPLEAVHRAAVAPQGEAGFAAQGHSLDKAAVTPWLLGHAAVVMPVFCDLFSPLVLQGSSCLILDPGRVVGAELNSFPAPSEAAACAGREPQQRVSTAYS